MDRDDDQVAREGDEEARASERELTVIELMNGPRRASPRRRNAVLWVGLAFASLALAMTIFVIGVYGLDFLTLISVGLLVMVVAAMVGALRYKGEDPMAKFDPPERASRRPRG